MPPALAKNARTGTLFLNWEDKNKSRATRQAYTDGPNWGETFSGTITNPGVQPTSPGIDTWGNVTSRSGVTGKSLTEGLSAIATAKNQLTVFGYDAAGNMISNGSANYVYDAENRLIAAGGMSYVYDGDGKRVKKCTEGSTAGICATGATGTLYWGVPGSETLAETDLAGNVLENYIYFNGQRIARREPTSPPTIHFYFSDHLGTHSLITDLNGTMPPQEESDYFPYGGEIPISGGDSNHYKFTGKERDSESGLDNFGARFFTSNIGRFMTPDWAARPTTVPYAVFGDPQSLNLYGYVRNDPVSSADADGHGCFEGNRDNPGNCSGDLMNAFVNDLAGLGAATHDTYDDTDTWSMLEEMATPSAQNTTQQQVNRQPDGSYKATPAQLAEIRAADKNGTIITNQSDPLGQCVTACERFTGVPGPTSSWRKGKAATDLTDKDIGTAIATFQGSGVAARYKSDAGGHKNSGIFMGTSVGGFWMADQCRGKSL